MKKTKLEDFIKKAREVHGDKYDYSKVEYVNCDTKVCIICHKHGEFWQTPYKHLKGQGCPKCVGKNKTTEQFIDESREVHGDKYDYSKVKYRGNKTKVCIICPEHGEFWQTPSNHLNGEGCSKCAKLFMDTDMFKTKSINKHKNKYIYSESVYVNYKTPICIICPEHGKFWQIPYLHMNGCGCPKCAGNSNKTTEEFINEANEIHNNKYDYSKVEYKNNATPVCIICPEHGEFWQTPRDHLDGCGCPKCKTFHLETEIELLLAENNINYIHPANHKYFKWLGKQHFDFYIPEYNSVIECQGIQHFKPTRFGGITFEKAEKKFERQKELDAKKKKLCEENNIKLYYYSDLKINYPYFVYIDKNVLLDVITNKE